MNRRGVEISGVIVGFAIMLFVLAMVLIIYGNVFTGVHQQLFKCETPDRPEFKCAHFWSRPPAEEGYEWVMYRPVAACKKGKSCFVKVNPDADGEGGGSPVFQKGGSPVFQKGVPDVDAQILDYATGQPVAEDARLVAGTTYVWLLKSAHRLAGRCDAEIRNRDGLRIPTNGILTKDIPNCRAPRCELGGGDATDCFTFRIPPEKQTEVPFAFHFTVYDVTAPSQVVKQVTRILIVEPDPAYTGPPLGDTTPPPRPATIRAYHWLGTRDGPDRWGVAFTPVTGDPSFDYYTVHWTTSSGGKTATVRPADIGSWTPVIGATACHYPTSLSRAMTYYDVSLLSLRRATLIAHGGSCAAEIYFVTDEASTGFTVTTTDRRGNSFPPDPLEPALDVESYTEVPPPPP